MIILTFLQQFLNIDFNIFYKSKREEVRKYYNIPSNDKLWFNGFDYKPIIFINNDGCLEEIEIPIQRMVWIKNLAERVHIYLRPSFVIKRCPFPASVLEYVWNECIIPNKEPFDVIDDPDNLFDSSLTLEYHTRNIFERIGAPGYLAAWNHLWNKTFYSLSSINEKDLLDPNASSSKYAYQLIKMFTKSLKLNVVKYGYLSFANFQIPLK